MSKNQHAFAVTAICLSIIIAGAIIAYKPGIVEQQTESLPFNFRYPSGVGVSQGVPIYSESVPTLYSDASQLKTISLSGSGTATAQADQASINLGVTIISDSAEEAIRENAEKMTAIVAALKALGISEEDIQTTSYSVYPEYDWTDDGRELKGYTVVNMVQVTVLDLDMVGDVIDAAGDAGANQIYGISFELSDSVRETLKTNAYIAALTDAQDKADVIADTLGLTITGVQSVSESSYVPSRNYDYEIGYAMAEDSVKSYASTPVISGELSVTVSVYIVFLFV